MSWLKKLRRKRIIKRPFPEEWLAIIRRNVPYYQILTAADKAELQRHILIFLAEKKFEGCQGLQITDEVKVTIAAQACMLLLHRETDYYPGLHSILVYPQAYIARYAEHIGGGIVIEGQAIHLGQSWRRGYVVLSWDDVRKGAADIHDGHNVVLHEFAHQLDSSAGKRDSSNVLRSRSTYIAWARTLEKDFQRLRAEVRQNQSTFLDRYGAANPAEFFAVATEYFFEKSRQLKKYHPQLYQELKNFYHQDPAGL